MASWGEVYVCAMTTAGYELGIEDEPHHSIS